MLDNLIVISQLLFFFFVFTFTSLFLYFLFCNMRAQKLRLQDLLWIFYRNLQKIDVCCFIKCHPPKTKIQMFIFFRSYIPFFPTLAPFSPILLSIHFILLTYHSHWLSYVYC